MCIIVLFSFTFLKVRKGHVYQFNNLCIAVVMYVFQYAGIEGWCKGFNSIILDLQFSTTGNLIGGTQKKSLSINKIKITIIHLKYYVLSLLTCIMPNTIIWPGYINNDVM